METTTEEIAVTQNKKRSGLLFVAAALILVTLVAAVSIYINELKTSFNVQITELQSTVTNLELDKINLDDHVNQLTTINAELEQEVELLNISNCKGKWSKENGCENDLGITLEGIVDNKICFGDSLSVSWDPNSAPNDTVDILLTTPQTTLRLDTVRSTTGLYEWSIRQQHTTADNRGSATITAGDLYKIRLQSGGQPVENGESDFFAIQTCG